MATTEIYTLSLHDALPISPKTIGTGTRSRTVYTPAWPVTAFTDSTCASTPPIFTDTVPDWTSPDVPNPVPQSRISSPGCAGCAATCALRTIANSVVPTNEATPCFGPGASSEKIHGEALRITMLKGSLTPFAVSTPTSI